MRFSRARRFKSLSNIRWQKDWKFSKSPPSCRSATILSMSPRPMPFTAARPNRMPSSTTVKSGPDSLMSGGSRRMPISLHSAMYSATLPLESKMLVSRAAMYSLG